MYMCVCGMIDECWLDMPVAATLKALTVQDDPYSVCTCIGRTTIHSGHTLTRRVWILQVLIVVLCVGGTGARYLHVTVRSAQAQSINAVSFVYAQYGIGILTCINYVVHIYMSK